MALSAADVGSPLCEEIASICAEVAERHYAELGVPAAAEQPAESGRSPSRPVEETHPPGAPLADVVVVDVSDEVLAGSAVPHVAVRKEHLP